MHGKVFHAPLPENIKLALEVGCGTGVVTCYLGRRFPSTHIYGVDISQGDILHDPEDCIGCSLSQQTDRPTVPPIHHKPSNVTYVQGDIYALVKEQSSGLQPGSLDLYFHRMLVAGLTDWPTYVRNAASLLRPGGYIELQDMSIDLRRANPSQKRTEVDLAWFHALKAASQAAGMDWDCCSSIEEYMKNEGLVDITVTEFKLPIGPWLAKSQPETKTFGEYGTQTLPLMKSLLGKKLLGSTYSQEEMEKWEAEMKRACAMIIKEGGWYFPFCVTVGRKP